jgi:hypothetical protein
MMAATASIKDDWRATAAARFARPGMLSFER